jgi:type VI secretion system protein ImpC
MSSSESQKAGAAASQSQQDRDLVDEIIDRSKMGTDDSARRRSRDILQPFIDEILKGRMTVAPDTEAMINARIAQIDELVSLQLNEVLHAPEFQRLEASWRGLRYTLDRSETSDKLKIRVFNISKKELLRELQRAPEFDQSSIFKKVYEDGYGIFGGEPFAALVGDYEFGKHPQDTELLEKMASVAAAAHAPFLTAAAPDLLNLESFADLGKPRDLAKVFDNTEFVKWKSFRESEDSRYVGLALPHILMRLPYGKATSPIETFNYEEGVDGTEHNKYLWGNAAYALATRLTNAFALYGWCAAIRGPEGGGKVEGLPAHTFRTDEGDVALKCPTEIAITDRREKELADQGLIPLVHCKNTDFAAFFSVQSAQKPKLYDKDAANASARLSAQLPYILAVSRFAHYLKAMMRDRIGSFMSRSQCETFLNNWIKNYTIADDDAPAVTKAKNPLREARVDVVEVKGKPGAYRAVAYLRPHYQLDELAIALRLVADLPEPAK